MGDVFIVTGVRTPIGNLGGAFKDLPAQKLGEPAVREIISLVGLDPTPVDEVIVGCGGRSSDASNMVRLLALQARLPIQASAYSVQRNCSSGLQPFLDVYRNIRSQDAAVQIAGGAETMSRALCPSHARCDSGQEYATRSLSTNSGRADVCHVRSL